ncbi:MAG TPA: co-chaperone DjlA [Steroidobacter sp.]|nr:co-chaperone DjlA [Steroidobacter sp.]
MSVVFLFAFLGLLVGGLRGLIAGAALGCVVSLFLRVAPVQRLASVQTQFFDSTFAVMGAVCKADGLVTRDEIAVAETLFARLNLTSEQRDIAKAAFNRGKAPGFDLDGEVARFARATHGHRLLLITFLQIQCAAVAGDGNVHPAEHQMLLRIARLLGLAESDVEQLEALLRASSRERSSQRNVDDAYAALGLTPAATDAEIKRAYRRLMSQHHPDKLAGKGLPESIRAMAEERTREISTAYAVLKEARGFT